VTDDIAFLLAGMPPVDLIASERVRVKARAELPPLPDERSPTESFIKRIERKATIIEWNMRWLRSIQESAVDSSAHSGSRQVDQPDGTEGYLVIPNDSGPLWSWVLPELSPLHG